MAVLLCSPFAKWRQFDAKPGIETKHFVGKCGALQVTATRILGDGAKQRDHQVGEEEGISKRPLICGALDLPIKCLFSMPGIASQCLKISFKRVGDVVWLFRLPPIQKSLVAALPKHDSFKLF